MRTNRGFTLVELLITVTVMGVLMALAVPGMGLYVSNTRIRSAADEFRDGLNLARMEAIKRNTIVRFDVNNDGWDVVLPGTGGTGGTADTTLASRAPSADGRLSVSTTATLPLKFNGSGRTFPTGTAMTYQVATAPTNSCQADGGKSTCLNVVISFGGQIRLCNPSVAAGGAQACS